MKLEDFMNKIMSEDESITLTICGSMRNKELMEKYCAYYTIRNNVVLMPINYLSIKKEVETFEDADNYFRKYREESHNKKILLSDAIIVVVGEDNYFGTDTAREIGFAYGCKKPILFTSKMNQDDNVLYFNYDKYFPLCVLKENEKWL